MIRFACPSCQAAYEVPDAAAGKKTICRSCGQRLQVPALVNKTVLGSLLPAPPFPELISPLPPAAPMAKWVIDRRPDVTPFDHFLNWFAVAFVGVLVLLLILCGVYVPAVLLVLVCVAAGAGVYLAPTIIASSRDHPNALAVAMLNILAGWFFVG